LLEGKSVNLRIIEKEGLPLLADWSNNPEFLGEYIWLPQQSRTEREKKYDNITPDTKWFCIEKKDGTKIGFIAHLVAHGKLTAIGYALLPDERGKGYGSEAVKILVDYLFLSKDIGRIQAETHPKNMAPRGFWRKPAS
jgi:ribosomal-protein-alanine N-acetyltransferase